MLEKAARELITNYGSLSIPWGKVNRLKYNNMDLPGNGADEFVGIFRVVYSGYKENNINYLSGGDSWVGVIEFGERIKARILLSYGNSTQEDSPHHGDQLKLFSEKKLRDALFYRDDVNKHIESTEILKKESFVSGNN